MNGNKMIKTFFSWFLSLHKKKKCNCVELPEESVIQYWTDIEFLCAHYDNNMMEQQFCAYILKGLNTVILQQMLYNTTFDKYQSLRQGKLLNAREQLRCNSLNTISDNRVKEMDKINKVINILDNLRAKTHTNNRRNY